MTEAQNQEERPDGVGAVPPSEPRTAKRKGKDQQDSPPGKEPSPGESDAHAYDRLLDAKRGNIVINEGNVKQQFIGNNMRFGSYTNIEKYKEQEPVSEARSQARDRKPEQEVRDAARPVSPVVFISYSHEDAEWLKKLQTHLAPLEREGLIDLRDDTKIRIGSAWRSTLQDALENVEIAITLVSANFFASDFIARYELPALLSRVRAGKTRIISLIISYSRFKTSELEPFQTANDPDKPLESLSKAGQNRIFMKVEQFIRDELKRNAQGKDGLDSSFQNTIDRL